MNIQTSDEFGNTLTFRVVEKIPPGCTIWNIGAHMGNDEYIPLCMLLHPASDDFRVNTNTLAAIKLPRDEVFLLRKAAGCGISCLKEAERILRDGPTPPKEEDNYWTRNEQARKNREEYWAERYALAENAYPIFQRISS